MCWRCDGYDEEEIERVYDLMMRVNGYILIQVADPGEPGWSYTVGMGESFGHHELLCLDIEIEAQRRLVAALADAVRDEGRLSPDLLRDLDVSLVPVLDCRVANDTVAEFMNRYGRLPTTGEYHQILLGESWLCSVHAHAQRRLDRP